MARSTDFDERDLSALDPLASELMAEPSRWRRITGNRPWLVVEPASGQGDIVVHVSPGVGAGVELIIHPMSAAPGIPLMPKLAERGIRTPPGWQLQTDVGWVIGWLAPSSTAIDELMRFALRVTGAVGGSGLQEGRWRARLEKKDPRPGRKLGKI